VFCVSPYLWCALPFSFCTLFVVIYELIYLWFISDCMLRGSSKRSYRTRSRKRRRYSGRRRTYRSYRRKRSRLSLDQRMTMVAVKNATSSKRQYGWIARDLGHLFPDVMAVKLYQSCTFAIPAANHYNFHIQNQTVGVVALISPTPEANYSTLVSSQYVAALPLGFARLCGSDPATSIYGQYLIISTAYDCRVAVYPDPSKLPEAKTDTGFERQFPPWVHMDSHVPYNSATPIDSGAFQDDVDIVRAQPSMRKQWTNGWANGIHPGDPSSSVAAYVPIEPRVVRWRGVIWPHRVLGKPFTQYLGDKDQWLASGGIMPVDRRAVAQFSGAAAGLAGNGSIAAATYHHMFVTVDVCLTFLFREPLASLV